MKNDYFRIIIILGIVYYKNYVKNKASNSASIL